MKSAGAKLGGVNELPRSFTHAIELDMKQNIPDECNGLFRFLSAVSRARA